VTLAPSVLPSNRRRFARATLWGAWLALGLGLAGCSPDGPDGPELPFEVGTGRFFTPMEEGSTVELHRGVQGGQHVFVSMRVWDLTNIRARVEMSMERASDGARVSSPYSVNLRFSNGIRQDDPATIEGLLLMVPDASQAVDRDVRITASFESVVGEHGSDTRTVRLQWATEPQP
jgi:hypothetical protein